MYLLTLHLQRTISASDEEEGKCKAIRSGSVIGLSHEIEVVEGHLGLGAASVGPDKGVEEERIGSLNLCEDP